MFDIIIKGGQVVDGSGVPPFQAEVGIKDGRIKAVGRVDAEAAKEIKATGLFVAPGFIDIHSHSDFTLLVNPGAESKIRPGVTTEVIGNCGSSAAPVTREKLNLLKEQVDLNSLGLEWDWLTMEEYPSSYAQTEELIELTRLVGGFGGIYSSHIRGEGKTLLNAVAEAIRIGQMAGVPVQISHHKATDKENWELIDRPRTTGLDVTADQYPYVAASNALSASLPGWMHVGGRVELLKRLRHPAIRKHLQQEMTVSSRDWENIKISYCKVNKEYEGMRQDSDPYETVFNLLIEEEATVGVVHFVMSEEDVRTVMKHEAVMIGSDGRALAKHGTLNLGKPHPRSYGTFPRVLGKYVRDEKVLWLEEAIRKMTGLPAEKLGLKDRGLIKEGRWADITIFNPESVRDNATYIDPHYYPDGIEYALVNGSVVIDRGEHTGRLAGRILAHKRGESS